MPNLVAVTVGDINGVGIKILINSWKSNKIKNFILFSDFSVISKYLKKQKIKLDINIIYKNSKNINFQKNKLNIFSFKSKSLEENTYKSLKLAYQFGKKKYVLALLLYHSERILLKKR